MGTRPGSSHFDWSRINLKKKKEIMESLTFARNRQFDKVWGLKHVIACVTAHPRKFQLEDLTAEKRLDVF